MSVCARTDGAAAEDHHHSFSTLTSFAFLTDNRSDDPETETQKDRERERVKEREDKPWDWFAVFDAAFPRRTGLGAERPSVLRSYSPKLSAKDRPHRARRALWIFPLFYLSSSFSSSFFSPSCFSSEQSLRFGIGVCRLPVHAGHLS